MSGTNASANGIDTRAIEWIVRLDRDEPNANTRVELAAWLAEDPRHRGAFLRAQAAWHSLDRLGILPSDEFEVSRWDLPLSRRSVIAAAGGAMALAAAAGGVGLFWNRRDRIETPLGEVRHVPLIDGSIVAVNTDSSLDVRIKTNVREISLVKGEVWVKVATDRKRPFVLAAGSVRVRAVGTAFAVRRRDDGVFVLVTEGVVETWTVGTEDNPRRVAAGSKVFVSDIAGPSQVVAAATQIERILAWRNSEIVLDGETLAEAADEFNRYNARKLTIDPALAEKRFVGWFHTDEPENFARAAAEASGATVIANDAEIHLAAQAEP